MAEEKTVRGGFLVGKSGTVYVESDVVYALLDTIGRGWPEFDKAVKFAAETIHESRRVDDVSGNDWHIDRSVWT